MSTRTTTIEARPFGLRDKIGYMFGDFGNDFMFIFASAFLMIFYTKIMGISGAIVGTLFLVARLIDAFADVTVGVLVDKAQTHAGGKYRVIMMRMASPVVIFSFLMYQTFFVQSAMWLRILYMSITYIVWGILYSCVNIPYGSMAAVISPDPKDRTSLSTFRSVGGQLASMIIGVITPMIVYVKDEQGNQIIRGGENSHIFMWVALVFSLCAFGCYLLCYFNTVERVRVESDPQVAVQKRTVGQMIAGAFSSRSMIGLLGSAIALLMAYLFLKQMVMYVFTDYFHSASMLSGTNLIEGLLMLFVIAPIATFAAKNFGHRAVGITGSLVGAVGMFILFVMHTHNPWIFIVIYLIAGTGISMFNLVVWAMITDVIDDIEVNKGVREDATCYSVYSFARKLGQAFGGWFSGVSLTWIGYQKGAEAVQSEATINGLYNYVTLLPAIFFAIMLIILVFVYPLSKKKVEENSKILQQRRAEIAD